MEERSDGVVEERSDGAMEERSDGAMEERSDEPMEERSDRTTEERSDGAMEERSDGALEETSERAKEERSDGAMEERSDEAMEERSGGTNEKQEERVDSRESSTEVPHHTWQPKGKYEIEKTEVKYEDVIPIDVPEVEIKEPPPPPKEPTPQPHSTQEGGAVDTGSQDTSLGPQTNGFYTPTSPIDIPEGIPLLARILPREERESEGDRIPLERLFTPATDGDITPKRAGKVFASSAFYRPDHPTIEDQVELAQKISLSLVDENNKMSRGQSMYIKRKKRSVKWIHDEAEAASRQPGALTGADEFSSDPGPGTGEESEEVHQSQLKEKPPLKTLMSSRGVQDYTQVQEHYSSIMAWAQQHQHQNLQQPPSPEVNKDIIADMQSPTGKGAALFAKRKKRMDKFIVDETTVQKSSVTESSSSSSTVISQQEQQVAPAPPPLLQARGPAAPSNAVPTAAVAAKTQSSKVSKSDRDKQQEQIIDQFMKNRQQTVELVQSPWQAALETGDPNAAFKTITPMPVQLAETVCDQASKVAIELPKPVPIVDPVPGGLPNATLAPLQQPQQQAPLPTPSQDAPVASQNHLLEHMSQADAAEKRQSFNLAAKGWGTYNTFYKPITFQAS